MPTLLSVHPHPDDESIAVGGTLVKYADLGVTTHVVTCTGGEAGDNLAGIELDGRSMFDVRREEMAAAAKVLGLDSHTWLGYRDSGMAGTAANDHPDAFTNVDVDEAAVRLAGLVRGLGPDVVISDDERGTYGHPDHVMAHQVTRRAVVMAADPDLALPDPPHRVGLHVASTISREDVRRMHETLLERDLLSPFDDDDLETFGTPAADITTVVDVQDQLSTKQAAMLAHRSQIAEDSAFFNLPDDLVERAFGRESFMVVSSAEPIDGPRRRHLASDLFEGAIS